jgi:hypothetical protein
MVFPRWRPMWRRSWLVWVCCPVLLLAAVWPATAQDPPPLPEQPFDGWVRIFDTRSLDGWEASENPGTWTVQNGLLVGRGGRSHLFFKRARCVDCEFKAEARINPGGNSGMYFRAQFEPGFPRGYEAQICSGEDPRKTGSLWGLVDVREALVRDGEWFTQHVRVEGNRIVIRLNGRVVVDTVDSNNTYASGYLALQVLDARTLVEFKNVLMRSLPWASSESLDRLGRERTKGERR